MFERTVPAAVPAAEPSLEVRHTGRDPETQPGIHVKVLPGGAGLLMQVVFRLHLG
jgi:hypothetical protein